MPTTCWSSIRGRVMRFTRLNTCGAPVAGAKNTLVTGGFVSVSMSPQYEDGESTRKKNAAGELCLVDNGKAALAQIDTEINFCDINPDAWNIVTGQPLVLDLDGNAVGLRIGETVSSNWALEVWTDVPGVECDEEGLTPYGYFLLPFLFDGKIGDFTIEETAMDLSLTSSTKRGSGWGLGPYNVDLNEPELPATEPIPGKLLTPIGPKDHFDMHVTYVAPPAIPADCSATALVIA